MVYDPAIPILEEDEKLWLPKRYTNGSSMRSNVGGSILNSEQDTLKLPMIPKTNSTKKRIANLS